MLRTILLKKLMSAVFAASCRLPFLSVIDFVHEHQMRLGRLSGRGMITVPDIIGHAPLFIITAAPGLGVFVGEDDRSEPYYLIGYNEYLM
jgi:hypothetical protein